MRVDIVVADGRDDDHLLAKRLSEFLDHHRVQLEDLFGSSWVISVDIVSGMRGDKKISRPGLTSHCHLSRLRSRPHLPTPSSASRTSHSPATWANRNR